MHPLLEKYNWDPEVIDPTMRMLDLIEKKLKMSKGAIRALVYGICISDGKRMKRTHANRKIRPAPTSKSRRRSGVSRGNGPAKKGRPLKKKKKRRHQLSENVLQNQANPKKQQEFIITNSRKI